MIVRAILVFLAVAASDVCWVRCVKAVSDTSRWTAANWAVTYNALISLSVIEYTGDHWMVIPLLLGTYVGTALGVRK